MDTLYHVSEVTFFLLTGGMIYWLIANNQPAQPEPAPAWVRVSSQDPNSLQHSHQHPHQNPHP